MEVDKYFESYRFAGTYEEVGLGYGEELKDQIRENYETNLERLVNKDGISEEKLHAEVERYYKLCEKYSEGLVSQLKAMGKSSGIGDFGAMLLNVSRELAAVDASRLMECTSYAVGGTYTKDGKHYSGQNQDMTTGYEKWCSIVTFAVKGKPEIMFMLPAGNLAFSGMNSEGISCNRNFLFGSGWKFALPRYFSTRMALEMRTLEEVDEMVRRLSYPSSHHSLFADRYGRILSYEFDSEGIGSGWFKDCFVHTNHFVLPDMLKYEKRSEKDRMNSTIRRDYMEREFENHKGKVDAELIKALLSSHVNEPDCVCVHDRHGSSTIASMINCLDDGVMLAAKGNPCENAYRAYHF